MGVCVEIGIGGVAVENAGGIDVVFDGALEVGVGEDYFVGSGVFD